MKKVFDSELKVMEILWENGDTAASEIARILNEKVGWSKTTTYTVIKKCDEKGLIRRSEGKILCHALVSKDEVREQETSILVDKLFEGAPDLLVANLLSSGKISKEQLAKLREQVLEEEESE